MKNDLIKMVGANHKSGRDPRNVIKKVRIPAKSLRKSELKRGEIPFRKKSFDKPSFQNKTVQWKRETVFLFPSGKRLNKGSKINVWSSANNPSPIDAFPIDIKREFEQTPLAYNKIISDKRFNLAIFKKIVELIERSNLNFYVATSRLNKIFRQSESPKYSLEEVKQIYFQLRPELQTKIKFDFAAEKARKSELDLLHRRTAEMEEKMLQLCVNLKAIEDEIQKRNLKKKDKEEDKSIQSISNIQSIVDHIPPELRKGLDFEPTDRKCYLNSLLVDRPFQDVHPELLQNMKDYIFSMLNYDQHEPLKNTTTCVVRLWTELRRNIIILLRLQKECRKKTKIVSEIESALMGN